MPLDLDRCAEECFVLWTCISITVSLFTFVSLVVWSKCRTAPLDWISVNPLCKLEFHFIVASRWRIRADWNSRSRKRVAAGRAAVGCWQWTAAGVNSWKQDYSVKVFTAWCTESQLVTGGKRGSIHNTDKITYCGCFPLSYHSSIRFLYMKFSVENSAFSLSRHGLSEWDQVALKDPDEWTLGTNNSPSFLSLLFSLCLSFSPSSPPPLLCLGRWGNPGLFLARLAYPAIRGLDGWREQKEAEVKERWCALSPRPKTQIWGQKEENRAGHGASEWSGLETNTQAVLFNHLRCQLGVSR